MQYYPPPQCTYPNGAPSYPYSNCFAALPCQVPPQPQVVGEGDVTSVQLADGGVQLYFVPRPPHCPYGPEAWFIRTIPIPLPTCQSTGFNQQVQKIVSDQSFQNVHAPFDNRPGYHVKFHNDGATSTSDIHAFFPSLRCHNWFPKESVAVQASPRPSNCSQLAQPCHCNNSTARFNRTHKNHTCMEVDITCVCSKHKDCQNSCNRPLTCACARKNDKIKGCHSNSSGMSVEEHSVKKKGSKKIGKKDIECECPPVQSDKGCATVTERATSFEIGRETQATCGPGVSLHRATDFLANQAEVEWWYPKTPYSKKDLHSTESKESCDYDCTCDVDSD